MYTGDSLVYLNVPGNGEYTDNYPGILTLNRSLSAIFFKVVMFIVMSVFCQMDSIFDRNSYSKKCRERFCSKIVGFVFRYALYDIGFWARIKLGYSLNWPGTCKYIFRNQGIFRQEFRGRR